MSTCNTIELIADGTNAFTNDHRIIKDFDSSQITYFIHPKNNIILNVISTSKITYCSQCMESHQATLYKLERNIFVWFCPNYEGGNWIFSPTPST